MRMFTVSEDGQPTEIEQPKVAGAPKPANDRDKKKAEGDYALAKKAVESFGMNLAFYCGEMWGENSSGWSIVTRRFLAFCNSLRGKNTESTVYAIACNQLEVPSVGSSNESPVFWERIGSIWSGEWQPFYPTSDEVIFSDFLVNVRSGEQISLAERVIFGLKVSAPWATDDGSEPKCEEFLSMVQQAFPDEQERQYLQEICSTILQPHVQTRESIVFWGEPNSGKTTLATAIACAPAGMMGISSMQEAEIVRDKWATNCLINKFANVSDDSPVNNAWVSWMKRYTSGSMTVEPKFHKPMTVVPTAKLISTCNEMQRLIDASGAAGVRIRPFRFDRRITLTGNPEQHEKMTARFWSMPVRRLGIVQWLMEGLMRWKTRGFIQEPDSYKKTKAEALSDSDPLAEAIQNGLEESIDSFTPFSAILTLVPSGTDHRHVHSYVRRFFPKSETGKGRIDGRQVRGIKGVKLI